MLFSCLTISAVFLLFAYAGARVARLISSESSDAYWGVIGVSAVCFLLSVSCLGVFVLLANSFFVGLAALIYMNIGMPPRRFWKAALVATAISYGILICISAPELIAWTSLREEYPMESLHERLAYEQHWQAPASTSRENTTAPVGLAREGNQTSAASASLARLEERFEKQERYWSSEGSARRTASLKHLHAGFVQQFIDSRGFGAARMITRPSPEAVKLSEVAPIPLPPPRSEDASAQATEGSAPELATKASTTLLAGAPSQEGLLELHEEGLFDFVDSRRNGYVLDQKHVAGFLSHEFTRMPELRSREESCQWTIQRLELVSLLKHEEPAVYISEYLPRMKELGAGKTRSLDYFEKKALPKLQQGEDLETQYALNQIRVLGSIRASQQCLKCHHVERGDLLGAFTYDLRRKPPLR